MNEVAKRALECGIVGAGGAGFPTHVKLSAEADTFIINAAECEPLLYKDQTILESFLPEFIEGASLCSKAVGARRIIIGIKNKHEKLIALLERELPDWMELFPIEDTYPAGDEHVLVYETTGRVIPAGGLPLDVSVVVNNVETVLNVGLGEPVTRKFLTVSGLLPEAVTLRTPIGVPIRAVLEAVGAPTEGAGYILNGPMMGSVIEDLSQPVLKTTSGVIVLPADHPLIRKKSREAQQVTRISRACDQCTRCSDLCPRDLLGHGVKPHKAMTSVSLAADLASSWQESALYCCECGLCGLYSCPEDLDPHLVMIRSKRALTAAEKKPERKRVAASPHFPYRKTPTPLLMRRLDLERFVRPNVYSEVRVQSAIFTLPLKQHVGAASSPVVKARQRLEAGTLLADIPEGKLGAKIFSPEVATISSIEEDAIILEVS